MTDTDETFTPLELFSPSGLSTAGLGARKWAWIYILNLREPKVLWVDIKDEPKPVPKVKSRPTDEEKKAIKAYNKKRRPALGTEVHARIEQYFKGCQVDWSDEPGRIALSGLPHLPAPAKCEHIETEGGITLDLSFMRSGEAHQLDPIVFRGTRDLLVFEAGRWLLIDHKTTYTFDFIDRDKTIKTVKTPEQLIDDEQANIYALDVMQKHDLEELACRWVYYRTEGDHAAKQVDFVIVRVAAEAFVARMVERAKALRELMRTTPRTTEAINSIECDINSCGKFGGCTYHPDQGGPCVPPVVSMGARLVQLRNKSKQAQALKEGKQMAGLGFRDRALAREKAEAEKAAGAATETYEAANGLDPVPVEDVDPEAELEPSATQEDVSGAVEDMAEFVTEVSAPAVETPAQATARKARGPNKPKVSAPAATGSLGATIAELSASLIVNEQEHAAIVARMREVLS